MTSLGESLKIIDEEKFFKEVNSLLNLINFDNTKNLILGVSGGPDSMMLSHLLNKYSNINGLDVIAVIIDHQLRDSSWKEASITRKKLNAIGLKAEIFKLKKYTKNTGIQEWARFERLNTLSAFAKSKNGVLFLGHHLDDNIETVFMRMNKKTGFWGAAGIKKVSSWRGTILLRPFLSYTKEIILKTCKEKSIKFIVDDSNINEKFERVKTRNFLQNLENKDKILKNVHNFSIAVGKITEILDKKINELCTVHFPSFNLGWSNLDIKFLSRLNKDFAVRIMLLKIKSIGGEKYFLKKIKVEKLLVHLLDFTDNQNKMPGRTLGGCKIFYRQKNVSLVRWSKELIPPSKITEFGNLLYDNKWEILCSKKVKVGYLQNSNYSLIKNKIVRKSIIPYEVWKYVPVDIDRFNYQKMKIKLDVVKSNNHLDITNNFISFLFDCYGIKIKFIN
ncbi:MAG: tRNA lysidine(34) synthetase TilS [SAR116 cluster bacterium]|nr:tRNA lysidine(34) synthetase TilS [SAR116 cluster bacterium]